MKLHLLDRTLANQKQSRAVPAGSYRLNIPTTHTDYNRHNDGNPTPGIGLLMCKENLVLPPHPIPATS